MNTRPILAAMLLCGTLSCGSRGTANAGQTVAEARQQPVMETQAEFSADSAYLHIQNQLGFGPRIPATEPHAACVRYIIDRFEAYGADTVMTQRTVTDNYRGGTVPVVNILARYNSDAPRRILLLAHYDTRPQADEDPVEANRTRPVPGANDGASGVAVLLEIARLLGQEHPDVGVDLLMVDAEDGGNNSDERSWCIGTQAWIASEPYRSTTVPDYAVLLDMVGAEGARFRREMVSDRFARHVNDRVWAVAQASGFGDIFVNERGGAVTDDHLFLNRAGLPTVDIIDADHPATGAFPPNWHTVADDISGISTATLKAVGQTVTNLIYSEKSN